VSKARRPGKASLYVELPEALMKALRERVQRDRRPQTTVVIMALEAYLGFNSDQLPAEPSVEPSPAVEGAAESPPSKRGKGRPKKGE
jgi:hypothetical protein